MRTTIPHPPRELTPGQLGREVLHTAPNVFAEDLARWCDDDIDLNRVADWFEGVATKMRRIRQGL